MADLVTRLLLNADSFDNSLTKSQKRLDSFGKSFLSPSGGITTMASSVAKLAGVIGVTFTAGSIIQTAIQNTNAFEKSLSQLKSMTGLAADEMAYLKDEAIKLSSQSTKSAMEISDSFRIIGSQMPSLLKSKEALSFVTNQAIILAEAAGLDVPTAAKALTGSLNQMGKSAAYAGDYINILAAASQQGSADIPYLNTAIEKSGGTASAAGVQFNQLVAAIEAIAPKVTEASTAGTNLRNIFLKLEASTSTNLQPSVVGLTKALENLKNQQQTTAELTKMFGAENVTAVLALLDAIDTYKKYEVSITDTNTALEQQSTNNDNVAGSLISVKNSWDSLMLSFNQSSGVVKSTLNGMSQLINAWHSMLFKDVGMAQEQLTSQMQTEMTDGIKEKIAALQKEGKTYEEARKEAVAYYKDVADVAYKSDMDKILSLRKRRDMLQESMGPGRAVDAGYLKDRKEISQIEKQLETLYVKIDSVNNAWSGAIALFDEEAPVVVDPSPVVKDPSEDDKKKNKSPIPFSTTELNSFGSQYQRKQSDFDPLSMYNSKRNEELDEEINKTRTLAQVTEELTAAKSALAYADADQSVVLKKRIKDLEKEEVAISGITKSNDNNAKALSNIQGILAVSSNLTNQGAGAWLTWGANVMSSISSNMGGLKELVNLLMAKSVAESAAAGPLGWLNAVAAGIAVAGAVASLPKFANGGIVYGRTVAEVGEYAGANSNPEVIAPLSKLKDIIGSTGGGNVNVEISGEFRARGGDLVATINNYSSRKSRG